MTAALCPIPLREADLLGIQGVNLQNSRALGSVSVIRSFRKEWERCIFLRVDLQSLESPKNREAERKGNAGPKSPAQALTSCLDARARQVWDVSWFLSDWMTLGSRRSLLVKWA